MELSAGENSDSTLCMPRLRASEIARIDRAELRDLPREELEELAWQSLELARALANRLRQDSTNSSRPPSSDDPYLGGSDREKAESVEEESKCETSGGEDKGGSSALVTPNEGVSKRAGKQPGMAGHWRRQPLVVSGEVEHFPTACEACGAVLCAASRCRTASAHYVYELERGDMALRMRLFKHRYFVARCGCGHETFACPGTGRRSQIEGRKRSLELTERCLVGPMLATFIAALAVRCRLSRQKIREFLADWLGLELGTATINRCIHEFGLACEPVVEDLLAEIRAAEVVHLDETPWYQQGSLLWLWVAVTTGAVVFRIGSRAKQTLVNLIGEAFLGWLVSDGYGAYRDHPRRQRCLAHLIRKAVALADGYYRTGSGFGRDLARDLRRLIELVADGSRDDSVRRLIARLKWTCQCHQYESEDKVRALAREILNDWQAVIAFVADPRLPPTNNDAERALRHAVIARRISFGTRTDEGSRFYAAALSVIETCRIRSLDTWAYARDLIAAARVGAAYPKIPVPAAS